MIDNNKFEEAKKYLYLDDSYPLLHETTQDKIDTILSKGLNINKSYNGEIDWIFSFPKNEDEFKNYSYYTDELNKAILVIGIPKCILADVPIYSTYGHLIANCISEFEKWQESALPEGFQFRTLKYQKLPSSIPTKWILGYFNENSDFFPNPNYILSQNNAEKLVESSRQYVISELHRRYTFLYDKLFGSKQTSNNDNSLSINER